MMAEIFSHYVSLGKNCEVAFQFRRVLGRDSSSFFSWNVTSLPALKSLLSSRFDRILKAEGVERHADGSLAWDRSHDYLFHSPFKSPDPRADPDFEDNLAQHRLKTDHLIRKFYKTAESGESVVYFYKAEEERDVRKQSYEVRDLLLEIHGTHRNFRLVILQHEAAKEADWEEPYIANRYLARMAPYYDASDGHVTSYDRIFREFRFCGPMYFSGY